MSEWKPRASIAALVERARILKELRAFFDKQGMLEVDVPVLSRATVTDPHLEALSVKYRGEIFYLQTSPEFAMKRLLAAGMPSIYYLGKAFRADEQGRHHNPEFTMAEWYQLGFQLSDLMDEVDQLLVQILQTPPALRLSYQQAFAPLGLDPLTATLEDCHALALKHALPVSQALWESDRDTWIQLLFTLLIEPTLGFEAPAFVYDFPAPFAMLAQLRPEDPRVALRMEVYVQGIELANGFQELQDASLQRARFEADNHLRMERGLPKKPIDPNLLDALSSGLPPCCGIALGVDRLILLALKQKSLEEVLPFAWDRC